VEDVRASLWLPIATLPWSIFAVVRTHLAATLALLPPFLRNLRSICLRARAGNPFHADNGHLMRRPGFVPVALAVLNDLLMYDAAD
jgi:hypothetical protein